jgi:hypothetical protein
MASGGDSDRKIDALSIAMGSLESLRTVRPAGARTQVAARFGGSRDSATHKSVPRVEGIGACCSYRKRAWNARYEPRGRRSQCPMNLIT